MQQELELAPEIERRSLMEEQLCAVRGLAPLPPVSTGTQYWHPVLAPEPEP
jgi:hypothetical protein